VNDVTMNALHSMLRGLSARQQAIADNVANAETPNYTAKVVAFEDSLREALVDGSGIAAPELNRSTNPALPNGNNVVMEEEMVALQMTQLKYELATNAMSSKLGVLRTSISGGGR
jgi:flagellar basal-body rod protein FlgB